MSTAISEGYLWELPEDVPSSAVGIYVALPKWFAQLLWNRGFRDPQTIDAYLNGKGAPLDPGGFEHMARAVEILLEAKRRGGPVVIYGDYDVDGLTATALLAEALKACGLRPRAVIPSRADGYGLWLDRLTDLSTGAVLIAVDCGVSEANALAALRQRSVDTLVVDHHHLPQDLPPASAIIHPALSSSEVPYASVGLAFHLIRALSSATGDDLPVRSSLDLVALGTLADMVPLVGENRWLVRYGLVVMRRNSRPGLRALLAKVGLRPDQVNSRTVSFRLAPRLNAPGRLSDATPVLELLTTPDLATAEQLVELVETHNSLRREWFSTIYRQAVPEAQRQLDRGRHCIVLAADGWPPGLMGLLAARMVEEYWVPSVALARVDSTWRGSVRTPPGVSAIGLLRGTAPALLALGGHEGAGGLTLAVDRLAEVASRLEELAASTPPRPRTLRIDARMTLEELNPSILPYLLRLDPFGEGNPEPLVLAEGVVLDQVIGLANSSEARVRLASPSGRWHHSAIAYRAAASRIRQGTKGNVILRLRVPKDRRLDLELVDFRGSSGATL